MLAQNLIFQRASALFAGAIIPLSFAPFDLIIFSFVGLTAFAWLVFTESDSKKVFFLALCFGFGLFAVGVSWVYVSIHVYGEAPPVLATFLTLLFVSFLALLFAVFWLMLEFIPARPIDKILAFAALWVLVEWVRGWFLTGFPWLYIGQAHLSSLLSGWMPIFGTLGVSYLQAASCATLALALKNRVKETPLRVATFVVVLLFLLSPLLNRMQWTESMEPVDVALIQPNISLLDKWDAEMRDANLQKILDLSDSHWNTDILVWPEAALPLTQLGNDQLLAEVAAYLGPDTSLVTGRLAYDSINRRFHNNVIGLGQASGEYSKRRLVPFGEYVPLENLLRGLIEFFDLPMSVISPGDSDQELLLARDLKIAIALCYEIAYSEQVAKDSREANILLTVSNDTWFGDSIGPHQHLQIARLRARETGKPVLRGTNDGITAIIDSQGHLIEKSEQFVPTLISNEVTPYTGMTPFARWGQTPIVILAIYTLIFCTGRKYW